MTRTNTAVTLAVAIAAALISACSSSGSGPATLNSGTGGGTGAAPAGFSSKTVDTCKIMSAAQVSAASHLKYVSATGTGNMCNYVGADQNNNFFIIVTGNSAGDTAWKDQLSTLQEDGGAAPKTLTGAGDRAAGCGNEIGVQAGSYIVDVHGLPETTDGAYPRSIAVAAAVVAALH